MYKYFTYTVYYVLVCWAPIQLILLMKSLQRSNWDSSFNKIVGQVCSRNTELVVRVTVQQNCRPGSFTKHRTGDLSFNKIVGQVFSRKAELVTRVSTK